MARYDKAFTYGEKLLLKTAMNTVEFILSRSIEQTRKIATPQHEYEPLYRQNVRSLFERLFLDIDVVRGKEERERYPDHFDLEDEEQTRRETVETVINNLCHMKELALRDNLFFALTESGPLTENKLAVVRAGDHYSFPDPDKIMTINIFPRSFTIDPLRMVSVIVHELSHTAAGTLDYEYGLTKCMMELFAFQKIKNAENYAIYVDIFRSPQCRIRFPNVQLHPGREGYRSFSPDFSKHNSRIRHHSLPEI